VATVDNNRMVLILMTLRLLFLIDFAVTVMMSAQLLLLMRCGDAVDNVIVVIDQRTKPKFEQEGGKKEGQSCNMVEQKQHCCF